MILDRLAGLAIWLLRQPLRGMVWALRRWNRR